MKKYSLITFVCFMILAFVSCKKGDDGPVSIVGNWSLVSDSTYINFGVGNFDTTYYHVYKGLSADHFNFTENGKLYVQDGDLTDTANYTITGQKLSLVYTYYSAGGVTITGNVGGYTISGLTYRSLILTSDLLTPEGPIDETITLKRE